jgi:hypothetical protein
VRPRRAFGLAIGALAAAGCSGILGMDAPTLDPCAQGGCVDVETGEAAVSADVLDAPSEGRHDASSCADAELPESGTGVRCGGGCYPVVFCSGSTPVCCASTSGAGVPTFACTSSEAACSGYSIRCANENDCGGSEVCCHFNSHMVCDAPANCPNTDLACLPDSPQDCPTGKACDQQLTYGDGGPPSPYYLCHP